MGIGQKILEKANIHAKYTTEHNDILKDIV